MSITDLTTSLRWLTSRFPELVATTQKSLNYDDVAVLTALVAGSTAYLLKGIAWNKPGPYEYMLYERPQERLQGKRAQSTTRNIFEKMRNDVSLPLNNQIYKSFRANFVLRQGKRYSRILGFSVRYCRRIRQSFS